MAAPDRRYAHPVGRLTTGNETEPGGSTSGLFAYNTQMGKTRKQETRRRFRDAVFERDGYRCVVCGFQSSAEEVEHDLDAHHITPREEFDNGGYVKENGVSLCDPTKRGGPLARGCHYKAELHLQTLAVQGNYQAELWKPHEFWYGFTPKVLYEKIGSSIERAVEADGYLK